MRLLTGVDCPGCGLTRSIVALVHGQLALGFRCHHLGPAVFVLLLAQVPYRLYYLRTRRAGPSRRTQRLLCTVGAVLAAAILLDWAIRLPSQIAHPRPSVLFHRGSASALGTATARSATSPKESTHAHLHPHRS